MFAMILVVGCSGGTATKDKGTGGNVGTSNGSGETAQAGDLVGTYQAQIPEMKNAKADDPMAKMAQEMAKSMKLELMKDMTFKLTMVVPIEGKYTVDGNSLSLKVEKVMGMDRKGMESMSKTGANSKNDTAIFDKPLPGTISDGGKTISLSDPAGKDKQKLVFKKV